MTTTGGDCGGSCAGARGTGSVATWRRAQMVLLSAQGMLVDNIATVTFTSPDRVRDVVHNFNADGFDALCPEYRGGRPKTFTLLAPQDEPRLTRAADVCLWVVRAGSAAHSSLPSGT